MAVLLQRILFNGLSQFERVEFIKKKGIFFTRCHFPKIKHSNPKSMTQKLISLGHISSEGIPLCYTNVEIPLTCH